MEDVIFTLVGGPLDGGAFIIRNGAALYVDKQGVLVANDVVTAMWPYSYEYAMLPSGVLQFHYTRATPD